MSTTEKTKALIKAFIENKDNQALLVETSQCFLPELKKAFTDRRYTADEILIQGEKIIARMTMTAIHSGHFAGNAPTGKTVEVTQFCQFYITEGNIVKHHGWFDTAGLLSQIQTH